jgi:hypothetical protein
MFYLSRNQRSLIDSLARVVCPPSPSPAELAGEVAHGAQLSMRAFPAPARMALIAGMRTYDEGGRLYPDGSGHPARRMEPEAAAGYFESWWSSRLGVQRNFAKGIKGLIVLAYCEIPAVKEALGYTPEAWIEDVKRKRLSIYKVDIEAHAAQLIEPDPLGDFPL